MRFKIKKVFIFILGLVSLSCTNVETQLDSDASDQLNIKEKETISLLESHVLDCYTLHLTSDDFHKFKMGSVLSYVDRTEGPFLMINIFDETVYFGGKILGCKMNFDNNTIEEFSIVKGEFNTIHKESKVKLRTPVEDKLIELLTPSQYFTVSFKIKEFSENFNEIINSSKHD